MVTIIKATGEKEPFDRNKLIRSIKRAGVPENLQDKVASQIEKSLYENITTKEIYRNVTEYLGKSDSPFSKSSYSLKEAVMLLGPTGYPFEDYFAQVLEHRGYQVKTRQIIQGRCVTHEVDVIARKDGKTSMVEAKFHNSAGTRTSIHVPMYTKSRFDDVKERYSFDDAWIITNTKVTVDAIAFAECVGMKIFSWSYPEGGSLRDVIEEYRLFPITALASLTQTQKLKLLDEHVALCLSIRDNPYLLDPLRLKNNEKESILSEIKYLCQKGKNTPTTDAPLEL